MREVAVIGLIVHPYSEIAIRKEEIAQVEITDEARCCIRVVAISKLSVEQKAVVEQAST